MVRLSVTVPDALTVASSEPREARRGGATCEPTTPPEVAFVVLVTGVDGSGLVVVVAAGAVVATMVWLMFGLRSSKTR